MSKTIRLYPSLKEIPCEAGHSVLSALEKAGHALPNNCRAGACGECKVRVRQGQFDQGLILDMAISAEERQNGFGLMCMARPTSDVLEIEWGDEAARPKLFPPEENRLYIVTDKQKITPTIVKLRIRPLATPMRFWPGQYIRLGSAEEQIPYKSYSIANIPNNDGELVFYITQVPGGKTSCWIHQELALGQRIKIHGPYGTFIGNPSNETPVLCLASGSGLAPIASLSLAALLRGSFRYPVTVLFSAKTKEDIIDLGLFRFLQTKFRNFKFIVTLTQEQDPNYWHGRLPALLPQHFPDLSHYSLYIAGNESFVADCVNKAKELKANSTRLYTEGFTSIQS